MNAPIKYGVFVLIISITNIFFRFLDELVANCASNHCCKLCKEQFFGGTARVRKATHIYGQVYCKCSLIQYFTYRFIYNEGLRGD